MLQHGVNSENLKEDSLYSRSQCMKKKAKISSSIIGHDSRSNADTEMRISISKKHNGTSGESTQVKIVIPSTSVSSSNLKTLIGCASSSPSSPSASTENLQEGKKQKLSMKRTARKTMSSFTPRNQVPILSKPPNYDLVTLDSENEKDIDDSDLVNKLDHNTVTSACQK